MMALRRWTSTPDAAGDLLRISPRSGALRTGDACPPAKGTEVAAPAFGSGSARGALSVPRLVGAVGRPAGANNSGDGALGVGAPSDGSGADGAVTGGGWTGGGCWACWTAGSWMGRFESGSAARPGHPAHATAARANRPADF